MTSTVHQLKPIPSDDAIFELEDLAVGTVLVFHSRTGVEIPRTLDGVYRGTRLSRKKGAAPNHVDDYLRFDDGYVIRAGHVWGSVQWRLQG